MSYTINNTTGDTLVTLKDGTIDTATTDVSLFGKGYAGFGEKLNENFIKLLENFANTTAPDQKIKGQLWYDATTNQLQVYTGSKWKPVGGSTTTVSQPTNAVKGDMWFDTTNSQLYVYSGTSWILIGPTSVAGSGVTAMVPAVVESTLGTNKNVLKGTIGDTVVYVASSEEFTPKNTAGSEGAALITAGFATIKKGITLSTGISGNKFQGVATQADALNDGGVTIAASEFLRSNANDTTTGSLGIINDSGLTLGLDSDLQIYVVGTRIKLKNNTVSGDFEIEDNTTITGDLTVTGTLTSANSVSTAVSTLIVEDNLMVLNSTSSGLLPSGLVNYAGMQVNRGAGSAGAGPSAATVQDVFWVFDETYADDGTTTYGNAGGAWSAFRSGNNLNDKELVDIRANVFHGRSTTSEYADLAEKYTTDKEYPVGTVMCVGGSHETTATTSGSMPIGVISENPGFLMNKEIDGQAVALKGRVPVLVSGAVAKGDLLYVSEASGTASKLADDGANLVGIALENNADNGAKLVECVLKV